MRNICYDISFVVQFLYCRTKFFPFFKQVDVMDFNPTALKIICKYYGKEFSIKYLRDKFYHVTKSDFKMATLFFNIWPSITMKICTIRFGQIQDEP